MFKKKTVLVVGAGASKELGLPIGDELATRISHKLKFKAINDETPVDDDMAEIISNMAGARGDRETDWFHLANNIAHAMPLAPSIDNYLHAHRDNDRIVQLGKATIAFCILEAERHSHIYSPPGSPFDFPALHAKFTLERSNVRASWHNTFFKMLIEGVEMTSVENVFDNVKIISFNYDRCIEHYLIHAFSKFYGFPEPLAAKIVSNLEVFHPYGKVGELDRTDSHVPFGGTGFMDRVAGLPKEIRVFTEKLTSSKELLAMTGALLAAENVVFLGFSFGEMNMDLLQTDGDREQKFVLATGYGMSESNRLFSEGQIRRTLRLDSRHNLPMDVVDATCYKALNDFYRVLTS